MLQNTRIANVFEAAQWLKLRCTSLLWPLMTRRTLCEACDVRVDELCNVEAALWTLHKARFEEYTEKYLRVSFHSSKDAMQLTRGSPV